MEGDAMNVEVRQDDLPGIGRRFEIECEDGGVVTIVVHHTGRRDLYAFPPGADTPCVVTLRDEQAQVVAEILEGSWSGMPGARGVQEALDDLSIDWVALDPGSPATGRTVGNLGIRTGTGVTVMSILRGNGVIHDPGPDEELRAGDRLVVAGRRYRLGDFRRLVLGRDD
jgi:K+:H+ antiporter subunit KhtT